jgi:hypothetical protein
MSVRRTQHFPAHSIGELSTAFDGCAGSAAALTKFIKYGDMIAPVTVVYVSYRMSACVQAAEW